MRVSVNTGRQPAPKPSEGNIRQSGSEGWLLLNFFSNASNFLWLNNKALTKRNMQMRAHTHTQSHTQSYKVQLSPPARLAAITRATIWVSYPVWTPGVSVQPTAKEHPYSQGSAVLGGHGNL